MTRARLVTQSISDAAVTCSCVPPDLPAICMHWMEGVRGTPLGPPRGAKSHSSQKTACDPSQVQFLVEHQHNSAKVISSFGKIDSITGPPSACDLHALACLVHLGRQKLTSKPLRRRGFPPVAAAGNR